jgi:hypothetical protein
MTNPKVNLSTLGPIPGLDLNQMVVPDVEVSSLQPIKTPVKTFNMVSWRYDFFETACERVTVEKWVEGIITFSQRLAWTTQKPVIIGGEMKVEFNMLMKIVKKLSSDSQKGFLENMQPIMGEMGYLPSMSKSSLTNVRHLFMMNVFRCDTSKHQEIVQTWDGTPEVVADCFIASKNLELAEATLLDVEQVYDL